MQNWRETRQDDEDPARGSSGGTDAHTAMKRTSDQESAAARTKSEPSEMTPPRVLIVDDDSDILDVLEMLFTDDGFSTTCCGTSEAARAALAANSVNLVITDLRLVGSTGTDLVAHVRTLYGNAPAVIVLTAVQPTHASAELARIAQLGAQVIAKPFDIDDLLTVARRLTGWPGLPLT